MARIKVRLDLKGLEQIAMSRAMQFATRGAASEIADGVKGMNIRVGDKDGGPREVDLPVEIGEMTVTTDMQLNRAKSSVTLAHPAGEAVQSKHGALTKAAAQAGYTVKDKR